MICLYLIFGTAQLLIKTWWIASLQIKTWWIASLRQFAKNRDSTLRIDITLS